MQIAILGRQPEISLAELEALFGASKITPINEYAVFVDSEDSLPQTRLGGTMKSAKLLTRLEKTTLSDAFAHIQNTIVEQVLYLPEGKIQFGVSVYGEKAQRDWLLKQMLTLKKIIKKAGRSVRIIENKSEVLESAQVLYNKLTSPLGVELLLIKDGADIILAQTTDVQNIDEYGRRDFGRPMRDAYVGMLPPKLAQIMINLAVGSEKSDSISILDPFCGTGVVLQEALLMGYGAYGTDLADKMVDYSIGNLNWLQEDYNPPRGNDSTEAPDQSPENHLSWKVEQGDATNFSWKLGNESVFVAAETYLGTPLSGLPDKAKLDQIMSEANQIAEGFLKNIAPQLKKGTHLCLALPAWHVGGNRFLHLKMLDHLLNLGYNRLEFVHAKQSELIYHRTDQIVARELTILEKL